jgi:hypothetical protein
LQNSRDRLSNRSAGVSRPIGFLIALLVLLSATLSATTIVPISDHELLSRADVVVRGIVADSRVSEDVLGRPETVTTIEPLELLKGELSGVLLLHQLGGRLPDGRFFQLWGRPEYQPGHEVLVFAVARPEGGFQTAEMLLGKFEVQRDEDGELFAVPALVADSPEGVTVRKRAKDVPGDESDPEQMSAPRSLPTFLRALRQPGAGPAATAAPRGALKSVIHAEYVTRDPVPQWGNVSGLWRWTNGATAVWKTDGTANITSGGSAEANGATATWDGEPNSTVNYSVGAGGTNPLHLDALTSPCGWSSCLAGGGVIGCGGPSGGAATTWRGETWLQITGGEVWVRSFCTLNLYPSAVYQAVVTHELGHTLGLGHSDQTVSPHDVCRGDENAAQMRSMVQNYTYLGTDDSDAIRWLYGDGGNSCGITGLTPPTATTNPASGVTNANATLNGAVNPNGKSTTSYFEFGTTAAYGSVTASQSVGSGTSAVSVSAQLTGLLCGTTYHYRADGTNADGTGNGVDMTMTTSACSQSPTVTTGSASGITQTGATLTGTVNPNGTSTSAYFQYGTTTSYGYTTATQSLGSGSSAVAVQQALTGLLCGTSYHSRIVAVTAYGTTYGQDQAFATGFCSSAAFYPVTPCRLVDTRNPAGPLGGPSLAAGTVRSFTLSGVCGLPAGSRAISVNVTAVAPTDGGYLTLYAGGTSLPLASTVNYKAGKTRANDAVVTVGAAGDVIVWCGQGTGTADLVLDVNGYFR